MSFRDWANDHPKGVAVAAVVSLAITAAVGYMTFKGRAAKDPTQYEYFYNLKTEALLPMPKGTLPPVTLEDDAQAVQAIVYSCGSCDDQAKRYVAWLRRYNPLALKAAQELEVLRAQPDRNEAVERQLKELFEQMSAGLEIRAPEKDAPWMNSDDPAAPNVRKKAAERCGAGVQPTRNCFPAPPEPKKK